MTATATLIPARLQQLRAAMAANQVHACLIPSADPHLSEYLPERWQGRAYFSGFDGSVGTLIVTADFAGLWVDSRYWQQAEFQLQGTGIELMKINTAAATNHLQWLSKTLKKGESLAVDGQVLGLAAARQLQATLVQVGVELRSDLDLLQEVWDQRPGLPTAPVYQHEAPFAVTTRAEKLALVRAQMQQAGCGYHFISTVDDIAWLLNLRGSDVNYNPVFIAHCLLSAEHVSLFTGLNKIPAELQQTLAKDGVKLYAYEETATHLAALDASQKIWLDPRRVTYGLKQALPAEIAIHEAINPSVFLKSRKSEQEIAFVREAMEQDGAALCEFFAWFEANVNRSAITELTIDEQICAARARQPHFVSPSFGTIAGFNANGALPHYRATPEHHAKIEGNGLLLIDSGGQYLNGTTDITRVVAVGQVSAEQQRDFTLVLKGMINLSRARFPRGTPSPMLDSLARAPIWAESINFGHGTGHGVGYFMNVHEGPQSISGALAEAHTAMEPGMITSNEPGIYRPGQWGVRIENLVANRAAPLAEFGEFLEFETLTLCPIDVRCIALELLREDEKAWLNDYHQTVRQRLQSRVSGAALDWLIQATAAI